MKRNPQSLANQRYDVLVIGAGVTGAWIALDCAQRGMSVALIDRGDFGAATSAKSSKLLHGGIRYLQQMQFAKVRESAMERAILHRVAPHLSHFVPFLVPTYQPLRKGKLFLQCGMRAYDLLCSGEPSRQSDAAKRLPPSYTLTREHVLEKIPLHDEALTGGVVFYESQMESSERMTLAIVHTAAAYGAEVANYIKVRRLYEKDGRVAGAEVGDLESGGIFNIEARLVINAAGPWVSELNSTLAGKSAQKITTGFSQGSHIMTRPLVRDYAIALPTQFQGQNIVDRGGRHVFILPWRGYSLIGTSYVAASGLDDLTITAEEVKQLTGAVNTAIPDAALGPNDIVQAITGIYPLQEDEIRPQVYQGTGEYLLVDHEQAENRPGLVTALGAKYTTARRVAEKATDIAVGKLGMNDKPSETASKPLFGADIPDLNRFMLEKGEQYKNLLDMDQIDRLVKQYGTEIDHVANAMINDAMSNKPLADERPNLECEITHAAKNEMALHLDDVVFRRTGIGTIGAPSNGYLQVCASLMAKELGWSADRIESEVDRVRKQRLRLPE